MDKILIVDDSILNLTVLSRILSAHFEVATCQNGADGLRMAAQNPPSLILLDLIMRGLGGFEVLERLKASALTKDIPVIILTGLEAPSLEEKALQFGAVDFIAKPFSPRVVLARVRTHVELYQLRKNAERMAMFDGLTDIPNRRSFDRQCQDLWETSHRDSLSFSIALADVDYFKGYNDHYGHPAGDNTLRAVALALHQTVLPLGGFAARYGGEEYGFLLPRFSADVARKVASAVRKNVQSLCIPYSASAISPFVTLSVGGVTVSSAYDGPLSGALEAADRMLYEAKENGRNQVRWTDL